MSLVKPRTMPGVLELSPLEQVGFQSMLDSIRGSFERFGFLPIETPVIELTEVLLTKTGGETERQVYFVQSTGALAAGAREQSAVPELALRYDLTVPLARYVAEHEAELNFPFRRYQIQRVYRGERAQRGRFREFYQCDIDVVGKDQLSVRYDAELPAVIYSVFQRLGVGKFTIHLNHRKLLRGFFEGLGLSEPELQTRVLREVDKLDKRGEAHVRETLSGEALGLSTDQIERVLGFVALRSSSLSDALAKIEALGAGSETLEQGKRELSEVLRTIANLGVPEDYFKLNFSIARGLDYYTGIVYETLLDEYPAIGSVCSGGRYENLAGHYTKSRLPGVGISIGATRLYWQLREAGLFGERKSTVQALVAQLDEGSLPAYLELGTELREAGINTEVVLEPSKLGKQFKYADRAKIRFVLVLGSDELAAGTVSVKDLEQQTQITVPRAELVARLRGELG